MKKKLLVPLLAALIGTLLMTAPVFADDSYSFTKVKTYSWICNGVHYHINYHANHFQVDRLDPDTGEVISSAPINLTVKKNEDSNASVTAVRPAVGLVYINVMRWYRNWIYVYDQKTGTASLAQTGANVGVKSGDYFIGSSRTPTDVSPIDYTIYKFTDTGCAKVKTLTKNGMGAVTRSGKFYYGDYYLPERMIYGDKYPDLHKIKLYRINPDGSGKTLLKTVKAKHKDDILYPYYIGAHKAKLEYNSKKITVRY